MDAITTLLTDMSIEGILLFVIFLVVSVKFLGELSEWCYNKLKNYFNIKDDKERRHAEVMESLRVLQEDLKNQQKQDGVRQEQIDAINRKLDKHYLDAEELKDTIKNQTDKISNLNSQIQILTERTQDSTRAYLIDKHHYFFYQLHAIDDMSLQDLERRFMYYKAAGGDTFIDGLMEDIRSLPRVTLERFVSQRDREEE